MNYSIHHSRNSNLSRRTRGRRGGEEEEEKKRKTTVKNPIGAKFD